MLSQTDIFIRLLVAAALGGLIGLERERHDQPAGLRTHIILVLGATIAMCISINVSMQFRTVATNGDPDRLALYHYAHLPHIFKPQRRIDTEAVPGSEEKLDILQYAVHTLTERGYVFIGMDHFAKPDDELAVALREGWLQRNFQGYSTYADCDLVAIGVSSIGKIGSTYSQNERDIDAYYAAIDAGRLPIMRGYQLNRDDILRRSIIQDLMCRFALDFQLYESMFGIPFAQYFKAELADLQQLAQLGLITMRGNGLKVTPKGLFLIRNVAMVFDHHLRHKETTAKYSQTV